MMRQQLLLRETDYISQFQTLAVLNVEIQESGATAERCLRKAMLEMDIGSFSAAADSAHEAIELRPDWGEAHYQLGLAQMLLGMTKAGVLVGNVGLSLPPGSLRTLFGHAHRSLSEALRLSPDDQDIAGDCHAVEQFIDQHPSDAKMRDALELMAQKARESL